MTAESGKLPCRCWTHNCVTKLRAVLAECCQALGHTKECRHQTLVDLLLRSRPLCAETRVRDRQATTTRGTSCQGALAVFIMKSGASIKLANAHSEMSDVSMTRICVLFVPSDPRRTRRSAVRGQGDDAGLRNSIGEELCLIESVGEQQSLAPEKCTTTEREDFERDCERERETSSAFSLPD